MSKPTRVINPLKKRLKQAFDKYPTISKIAVVENPNSHRNEVIYCYSEKLGYWFYAWTGIDNDGSLKPFYTVEWNEETNKNDKIITNYNYVIDDTVVIYDRFNINKRIKKKNEVNKMENLTMATPVAVTMDGTVTMPTTSSVPVGAKPTPSVELFKQLAQQNNQVTSIVDDTMVKISTDDILTNYADGITITKFDIAKSKDYGNDFVIVLFAEDNNAYYTGGTALTRICQTWADSFGGCDKASEALASVGGIRVKLEKATSKSTGRQYINVTIQ